ncbi:ABC transporter substrate-binding protein [Thalassotalea sp. G2M2-11]|uniref:ABC transporter substrate-binding protein n=1 Tax=Thalassotalea sp. G2M2-11 TaxID=2787627 RepID=UPI0019D22DE0|nr:ABC transporter substrate-binding protein [Thalassotalea sp. G2M2-11]
MNKKTFALLIVLQIPLLCFASNFKVFFLNPGYPDQNTTGKFWSNVSEFMTAAANDLNIELKTIYAFRNHILMKSLVDEIAAQQPNYVIVVNEKGIALSIIKQLAAHNIPTFMLLNTLNEKDYSSLSAKEKNLLVGSVIPNNYNAGYKLLNGLIEQYESLTNQGKVNTLRNLLILRGDYTTPASIERDNGLQDALAQHQTIHIIDSTVANWSKQQAYQKVKGILQRKRVDIIWAANDAMAHGAKKAVNELSLAHPVVIGGINWDVEDPHYPTNLSFGGHVTLGALALIMLKDIDNNQLPKTERHQVIDMFESSLTPYSELFKKRLKQHQLESYDFSQLSYNADDKLPFTIENITKTFTPLEESF